MISQLLLLVNIFCLIFANTYHVDTFDQFRKSILKNVVKDIDNLRGNIHLNKYGVKISDPRQFINQLGLGDPNLCFINLYITRLMIWHTYVSIFLLYMGYNFV